ncbi:MAG TPA: radical SAM protein [Pirellulales bacterium]|nr:radical SAM protein [Pirellulales bacterium]
MKKPSLDVVLVNPASRAQVYQSLAGTLAAVETPVWACLMAAFARRQGLSVELVDAEAMQFSAAEAADVVGRLNPRLAVIVVYGHQPSASTQIMPAAGELCRVLKAAYPEIKLLLVGGHVAALPERTLREEHADFVAAGEGLRTIVDLVAALKSSCADLSKVRGLCYRDAGAVRSNAAAPLVAELDRELPGGAWDLLPMDRYRAHNWHCFGGVERQPYAALYTTLGCPYHCSFCCIQAPFKAGERESGHKPGANSYRFWSAGHVLAEIETLVERHGVRNIKIADEMFVLNNKHVLAICDGLIERGYDLNLWAYARVDTVRSDVLDKLRRAGFRWLAFGIEAASDRVRDDVDKRFDQRAIYASMAQVRAADIHVIGNYIFGLPEDDHESMRATLDLALELNCEFANFYSTMAYPGSALYAQAIEAGWPLPDTWSGYSQHSIDTRPLPTRHLSSDEVLEFRDVAFQRYFGGRRYLDMVRVTFGDATTREIAEMASHKLIRRNSELGRDVVCHA